MYKVRFHLGAGEHFMHWQVRGSDGSVVYYDPTKFQLELLDCKLVNKVNKAKKVYDAGVKDVCGWVECEEVIVAHDYESYPVCNLERLYFNPIKDIHWRRDGDDGDYSWDSCLFDSIVTDGRSLYVLEEAALMC